MDRYTRSDNYSRIRSIIHREYTTCIVDTRDMASICNKMNKDDNWVLFQVIPQAYQNLLVFYRDYTDKKDNEIYKF